MSFTQKANFYNETDVYLDNIIIVGKYGEDISSNYTVNSFRINFNNLKPKNTYIYNPDNSQFQDSIIISFQLHESANINLSIYDVFEIKKKTIANEYMNLGIHNFTIDKYDEFQEELSYGQYKIKLIANNHYMDSIYVIYQK